jgi:hypothetical protein
MALRQGFLPIIEHYDGGYAARSAPALLPLIVDHVASVVANADQGML